jgi:N-methylhydantoinase B/oxoprolinase/acetone carboxylase alpha subunit
LKVGSKRGIGPAGESLRSLLEASERRYNATGHYFGIRELRSKKKDPVKYEVLHSKLLHATVAAREMARMISASPILRELAELSFVIFTPEGDTIAHSTGILVHVLPMSESLKWAIREGYEEKVGIKEGDIFESNETTIGDVHTPDVYDFVPIFWKGELAGWAGAVTHESDPGATEPGGMGSGQVERFFDGLHLCMQRVGEKDKLFYDYEKTVERSVRLPQSWILDTRARIAGCLKIREAVREVIEEYGLDYYLATVREFLEEERQAMRLRLKERTIPGRYRDAEFLEFRMSKLNVPHYAKRDYITQIYLETHITKDGQLLFDLDGTGSWGYHSVNTFPPGLKGGLCICLIQTLAYDGKVNGGTFMDCRVNAPKGTICNPDYPYASTAISWGVIGNFELMLLNGINRAYFSRGYKEEIFIMHGGVGGLSFGGIDQYGRIFGMAEFEVGGAGGSGARGVWDGIDTGYAHFNPESDFGNAEVWELFFPFVYIGRRTLPDSGGFGKFRGGNCLVSTWMIWNTPGVFASHFALPVREKMLHNSGLMGGYPAPARYNYYVTRANTKKLIDREHPLPRVEGDTRSPEIFNMTQGELHLAGNFSVSEMLHDYDLYQFYNVWSPAGYGDPLERDPELVRMDLESGYSLQETAMQVYGVVVNKSGREWKVDSEKTDKLRAEIKSLRKKRGIPAKDWWTKTRSRLLVKEVDPLVLEMFADSSKRSDKFAREFLEFWGLPDDFFGGK